jgi:hypothetical protein
VLQSELGIGSEAVELPHDPEMLIVGLTALPELVNEVVVCAAIRCAPAPGSSAAAASTASRRLRRELLPDTGESEIARRILQSGGRTDEKGIADSRKQKPRAIDLPHNQREVSIASWLDR